MNIKQRLKRAFFKFLKTRFWGLAYETDLPPEFVISLHAQKRLKQRAHYLPDPEPEVINAWYNGTKPPEWFKNTASKPPYFARISYRYFNGKVFVFGLRYKRKLGVEQKTLLTIYI